MSDLISLYALYSIVLNVLKIEKLYAENLQIAQTNSAKSAIMGIFSHFLVSNRGNCINSTLINVVAKSCSVLYDVCLSGDVSGPISTCNHNGLGNALGAGYTVTGADALFNHSFGIVNDNNQPMNNSNKYTYDCINMTQGVLASCEYNLADQSANITLALNATYTILILLVATIGINVVVCILSNVTLGLIMLINKNRNKQIVSKKLFAKLIGYVTAFVYSGTNYKVVMYGVSLTLYLNVCNRTLLATEVFALSIAFSSLNSRLVYCFGFSDITKVFIDYVLMFYTSAVLLKYVSVTEGQFAGNPVNSIFVTDSYNIDSAFIEYYNPTTRKKLNIMLIITISSSAATICVWLFYQITVRGEGLIIFILVLFTIPNLTGI